MKLNAHKAMLDVVSKKTMKKPENKLRLSLFLNLNGFET